ncbi:hypothetical protein RHSIM_Rhsim06G0031800 [Rhododendron simsii]|uniref:Tubby-like F-box protein n=1 Tax=Rhododendron simsii TaxID=118357 RepID=A0A834GSA4_RHOSS|nr:hypothetical protein RHSIM_Rhsim06G0031800 [Rhododendron simsii]
MKMAFKGVFRKFREMKDDSKNKSRRRADRKCMHGRGRSHIAPESSPSPSASLVQESHWANLPPELLLDIIQRLEASQTLWPARRDVVACGAVCRLWRETVKEVVRTPEQCGLLTFPISVKQIISWMNNAALSGDFSKLLLAARKIRRTTSTNFVISLGAQDFSKTSDTYIGKLRSNLLGTKFSIYDCQPPCDHAIQSKGRSLRNCYSTQQLSSREPTGNHNVATISYELNLLRTRGPRRMFCAMQSIPISAIQEGGTAPTPSTFRSCVDERCSRFSAAKAKQVLKFGSSSPSEPLESVHDARDPLMLKNKAPRWHEQLQCWCLNFKGRVTVASVKNFQLVAAVEPCHNVPAAEQEKVILQFGKIGKDIFTMDYCYPLSAFQAFAICLSSFDTKPACE